MTITLALSDGATHQAPTPRNTGRLQRKLCRAKRGSTRRERLKVRLARRHARDTDTRKDFVPLGD